MYIDDTLLLMRGGIVEITLRFVKTTKKFQHYEVKSENAVGQVYLAIEKLPLPPAELTAEVELAETAGVAR
jgi:hypothetical protein